MPVMAEYTESICRRCFHSYVCEQFNEHRDDNNKKCHFFNDHFVPAADVAPVRHGRWVDAYGVDTIGMVNGVPWSDCTCSICGEYLTGSGEYPAKGNYCPNCGAKMDLEGGDGDGR